MAKQEIPPEMEFESEYEDDFDEYAERVVRKPNRYQYAWEKQAENLPLIENLCPFRFTHNGTVYGATTAASREIMRRIVTDPEACAAALVRLGRV